MRAAAASWVGGGAERRAAGCGRIRGGRAAEAARRAAAKVRRYCAANRLNRLGTLTYAGRGLPRPARAARRCRGVLPRAAGGARWRALPYVWVPEWHPGGHGLHVHFAVGRYVPRSADRAGLGAAGSCISSCSVTCRSGRATLAEARLAARYLAKYVRKGIEDGERLAGLHRYEVAQGFQPATVECSRRAPRHVIEQASEAMGAAAERVWRSSETEGWHGPPACWAQWD